MIKKRYIILVSGIVSVLLASLFFNNIILAQTGGREYDPWLDYNEDGVVDALDLFDLSKMYASSGDPTKNVNVTNFPLDEYGNLKASITEQLPNNFLTAYLRKVEYHDFPPALEPAILSNSSEIQIDGKDIVLLGGDVAGGLIWSWTTWATVPSVTHELEGTGGWSQGLGKVELYDSAGSMLGSITLPTKTKIEISNVTKLVLIVEVPLPGMEHYAGHMDSGYAASVTATVYWIEP